MEKNQYNMQNLENENETEIKDLFMALWRQKVFIISITLAITIFTGIFSFFVLSPVYHSKVNIVINMPEIYHTQYGDYTLPLTTNQQYINLITSNDILVNTLKDMGYSPDEMTIDDLREKISIDTVATAVGVEQNSFNIKVAAENPQEAKKIAQTLYDNYIEFLDVMTEGGAVAYYTNDYSVKLKSSKVELETNQELLKKNEELLAATPQTINQKEAMNEVLDKANTSEFVILENIINPNYTLIENDIIINKQTIFGIENSISLYNTYLKELDIAKNDLASYNETGDFEQRQSSIGSITKANVYLPSPPATPSHKTSPSNTKNIIIGAFLGGMLGVLIAFIKEYWFKKA
ncbi:MAG: capA [Herbinix sp.]|nr:capA [Herbinix sp.]